MYWFQRWFEKIAAAVHSESSEIQNALQDNKKAIDAAKISQDNAWSSIERQIAEMRSDDEYKRGANTYKHKSYRQQVVLNILTGLLAIFTLGAFAAAGIYACIANRQLGIMREATTNAEDAMKIDQRAWVTVSDIKRKDSNTVAVFFGNSGKTPAKEFRVHISGEPLPFGHEPSVGKEDPSPGVGLIAPNGFFHVDMSANGSYDPETRVAIHGRVDYWDIFKNQHWTKFCYYLISVNGREGFAPCSFGNETDDASP